MRTLDEIIDQEYENDDGEIICQLEREIKKRDDAILELFSALEEHYSNSQAASLTRMAINSHHDFVDRLVAENEK